MQGNFLFIILIVIFVIYLVGHFLNWKTLKSPLQKEFSKGKLPISQLNGFYKGDIPYSRTHQGPIKTYTSSWKGKKFDSSNSSGINVLGSEENKLVDKYPFKTYSGKGVIDNMEVFKIDYNLPENPLWLKYIVDELVEVSPNHYLGKVNFKFIPGFPVALGFFELEK